MMNERIKGMNRPFGCNTVREVAQAIRSIQRDLPRLERDIEADQAQFTDASDITVAFRRLGKEILSLSRGSHRLHLKLVNHMEDWLDSSGPLPIDQSAFLRLRQRLSNYSDFTGHVCSHYGYIRMKSGHMPRPDPFLSKRLWRMVYLGKRAITDSLDGWEELVLAATGLSVKPRLWRNDDE